MAYTTLLACACVMGDQNSWCSEEDAFSIIPINLIHRYSTPLPYTDALPKALYLIPGNHEACLVTLHRPQRVRLAQLPVRVQPQSIIAM